ncbi:MAG: PspC domain-containing protein [Oscillospiraceae bacterium]
MKRLYRSDRNKMICGVCGGLAEYMHVDPSVIRLVTVLVAFCGGAGLLAYIIAAIIIPTESDVSRQS